MSLSAHRKSGLCHKSSHRFAVLEVMALMDKVSQSIAEWVAENDAVLQRLAPPDYLKRHYWWAYIHPWAVKFWDHLPIVNAILLFNYSRLRDSALREFDGVEHANVLQIAAVYGNLSPGIADRVIGGGGRYDIVDVLPIQLENVRRKLPRECGIRLLNQNSEALNLMSAAYDKVVLFFLLHEQPDAAKAHTLAEALRVLKPGGDLVIVDFAKPYRWNPFRYLWRVFLAIFEPFALAMWWNDVADMVPEFARHWTTRRERFFGGLFQKVVISRPG
jgi:ubiquinone/menaquinone biosynthesis C-methylase UbiE